MKKKAWLSAVLMACWGTAHADVTLYGLLDVGPTYVSNEQGKSSVGLTDGVLQESRFGFKGTEDLGNGYAAGFNLESGFDITNGTLLNGVEFVRRSVVTLSGPFGELTMGHDATGFVDSIARYTSSMMIYGPSYLSVHPGDYDRVFGIAIDNVIKYASPVMGGASFHAMVSPGGQPGSLTQNSTFDAGANYEAGPFSVGASFQRAYGVNISSAALLDPRANPFGATGPNDRLDNYGLGASYKFGHVMVHALVTQSKMYESDTIGRTYELGVKGNVTPFLTLGLDFSRTIVKDKAGMSIATASADYFLSKRTDLYFVTAYERVNGTDSTGQPLVAQMLILPAASGPSQLAFHLGVRHRF